MKFVSIYRFYIYNKRKFLSVFISVTLSVILLYTVQMIVLSSFRIGYNISVETRKYYSTISPKGEVLNSDIIAAISKADGVGSVIPCIFDSTNIVSGLGATYATSILSLENDEIPEIMKLMGLHLIEGKLPSAKNEIILHKQVALNKRLKPGNYIGRLVSKKETLPGGYKIVGIIDGTPVISFASIDYYIRTYHLPYKYIYGGIILPKEDSLKKMNSALDRLAPADYQIDNLEAQNVWLKNYSMRISILISVIDLFIILIVSSCTGFLSYIFFSQRRSEFGLLWAIGYSRQQVINRFFMEINGINLIGFLSGSLISILIGILLNSVYFIPIGDPLRLFDMRYLFGAACSPVFAALFSMVPVWRMLKYMDPISIIDGSVV